MPRQTKRPAKRKSKPKRRNSSPEWFACKQILDERTREEKTEYLIEWSGTDHKGNPWEPTWEPEVTLDVIEQWELKKKGALPQAGPEKRPRPDEDIEEDEPVPSTKRRKVSRIQIPSEEPTPSIISTAPESEVGTPVSVHSLDLGARPHPRISVEIKEPAINRSEYLSYSNTQSSSQLISELEEEDNRVAIASQISQGTIPDSQDLSADAWSQSQITHAENIKVSGEQNNIDVQEESLVIPDSQDFSLNPSNPEHSVSQEQVLLPTKQVTPDLSHQEIVPGSVIPDSDIPSHQPEQASHSAFPVIEEQDLLITTPGSQLTNPQVLKRLAVVTHQPQPPTAEPSSAGPVFLTQVPASLDLSSAESSYPSSVQESSRDRLKFVAVESQEQQVREATPREATPDYTESQAAQIVSHDFESPHDHQTQNETRSSPHGSEPPASPRRQSIQDPAQVQTERSLLSRTNSLSPSIAPSNQELPGSEMDDWNSRPSAAEEIRRTFGVVHPDIEDALSQNHHPEPSTSLSQGEPFLGTDVEVTTINPSVTIQSPQLRDQPEALPQNVEWSADILPSEQFVAPDSISPASLMKSQWSEMVEKHFGASAPSIASTLMATDVSHLQPETVSPADITNSIDSVVVSHRMLPASDNGITSSRIDSSGQSITMGQVPGVQDFDELSSPTQPEQAVTQHLVTLPFQASRRPYYDDLIYEDRPYVEAFSRFFSSGTSEDPDEALVKKIDELFSRLLNICDYPQHIVGTTLEELPASKQAKYVCDANPKFNFLSELLKGIKSYTEILIVARAPELLRLLLTVTESLELECTAKSIGKLASEHQDSAARVYLALNTEEHDPFQYDIVIGFDTSFNSSMVSKAISHGSTSSSPPLLLQLLTIHSIEHIAMHIPTDAELTSLERRNALLLGIVEVRKLIQDPEEDKDHEPHMAAQVFLDYLNHETETPQWVPRSIPDDVLDIYSQLRSQVPRDSGSQGLGLKHRLDDDDDDVNEEDAKRMRVGPSEEMTTAPNNPPIPDPVRSLLRAAESKAATHDLREAKMRVPIANMMVIAEQVAELERQSEAKKTESDFREGIIHGLEKQVKEYERTANKVSESYRQALEDRHNFEKEAKRAEAAAKAAQEAAEQESTRSRKRVADLEARIEILTAPPEGSDDSPLKILNQREKEAQDKIQVLERRLANASNDNEYIKDQYQRVTADAGALGSENKELRELNEELKKKASEYLVQIQQIQRDDTIREQLKTIEALKSQIRDKDMELDQLRVLKNGRPQTRQASVPRSPRTSIMSPRTGRFGGSASRGTSPAPAPGYEGNGSGGLPGMQFLGQQPGNSRWGHLRD